MGLSEAFYERVMANVNLKVMMRIGDNRTAADMTEWFGKITSTRKSVGAGVTSGVSSSLLKGSLDLSSRRTGGESQTVSYSEDEEDLVSTEELKHEMSAEKGLAWFDLGNGKIVKGRSFWFNASIPDTWEGREFIVNPERFEVDEIGLADWVDEQILSQEQEETSAKFATKPKPEQPLPTERRPTESTKTPTPSSTQTPEPPGSFKLGAMPRGGRIRGSVTAISKPTTTSTLQREGGPESKSTQPQSSEQNGGGTEPQDPPSNGGGKGPKTGPMRFRK
jgi:hypothetical protein